MASYVRDRAAKEEGELSQQFAKLGDYFERKLWHQLTEALLRLVGWDPYPGDLMELYHRFVTDFGTKMNMVAFVEVVTTIATREIPDPEHALGFLDVHVPKEDGSKPTPTSTLIATDPEALILLLAHMTRLFLRKQDTVQSRKTIERAKEQLDASYELSPQVRSAYYRAAAELHKVIGTAGEFYRNALMFLMYSSPDTLSLGEQIQWAFDLGIAALVGEDIYHFGELISNSVLLSLSGTEHQWLLDLLNAFHAGSIVDFEKICSTSAERMNAQVVLTNNKDRLRQKIVLLALMDLALAQTHNRSLLYSDVSAACHLPMNEVEFLLMRALSLKLISGVIDSVDETITVTRVQPRILGRTEIGVMASKISVWQAKVKDTLGFLEKETTGLYV